MSHANVNYQAGRLSEIQPSVITEVAELAGQLKAHGRSICNLSVGEPDFATAPHICDAANEAIRRGETTYPRTQGNLDLVDAVIARFHADYAVEVKRDQILVANGAKQILFNAFLATLDPGDEVIIPKPYWTSYPDIVRLCGGKVVHTPALVDGTFQPDIELMEAAVTTRTRWILLNSPSNPSGAIISDTTMQSIMSLLVRHPHLMLLCDEIYDKTVFDGHQFRTALSYNPDLADRILIVNGVSKTYAMTGWRIGFAIGPAPLVKAMTVIQGQSTSGACSIAQAAARAALDGPQDLVKEHCHIYQLRRDVVVDAIDNIAGLDCPAPKGAFYVLPSIQGLIGRSHPDTGQISGDLDLCKALLNVAEVATVPGTAFGSPNHIRLSYACSLDELHEAMRRIARFVDNCQ